MTDQKDAVQTSEDFLKALDKKIAKAGDFWEGTGYSLYNSYRNKWSVVWPHEDGSGRLRSSWNVKGEKNAKRALWLFLAAGKPESGAYSINRLTGDVFNQKKITISKEFAQDPTIKGAL